MDCRVKPGNDESDTPPVIARSPCDEAIHSSSDKMDCFASLAMTRPHTPPILQTIFHSSAVTGCTESREYFTSAISAGLLS
jgi:hypothetical protein